MVVVTVFVPWEAEVQYSKTTPILKKAIREFGLKLGRPTNSKSRPESCCENGAFTHNLGRECNFESCSENPRRNSESCSKARMGALKWGLGYLSSICHRFATKIPFTKSGKN